MLPTTLITILSFLLEIISASPVYNMQPAYITATIGSTGRNLRKLPCISRRSNQNGVCMFAIDCLKANGTHLGTCIDRFYFGSCCHVEPFNEIIENTIDTALIPARQPPNRTSTTEKLSTETTQATTEKEKLTTIFELTTKLTTIAKVTDAASTLPPQTTQFITRQPITTTQQVTTSKPITTTKLILNDETANPYKLSTFQSVNGNDITTIRPFPTTKAPRPAPTKPIKIPTVAQKPKPITTQKPKPVTAQKLNVTVTTQKPKPVTTQKVKPSPTKVKPVQNSTATRPAKPKPRPSRPTIKPIKTVKPPQKPVTTLKPVRNVTQRLPIVTRKPITTTILTTTERITTTTTAAPVTTSQKVETTTSIKSTTLAEIDVTTSKPIPIITVMNPILTTTENSQAIVMDETTAKATSTESNDLPINLNATSILEAVNGNPATNEIESVKPDKQPSPPAIDTTTPPGLVTWTEASEESPTSPEKPSVASEKPNVESGKPAVVPSTSTSTTKEPEDWVPITTPDGWVLLPSLSTVTEPSVASTSATSTTEKFSTEQSVGTSSSSGETMSTSSSIETVISSSSSEVNPVKNDTDTLGMSTIASVAESTTVATSHDVPVNMSDFTHVCGRRMFPEARIVGGEKSSFGKWPWQISLRQWRTSTYLHKCGAALLNENWAITAAHCVDNVPPSDLLLRLGEHDLSTELEPYLHQERRVQIVASHPQFDPRTFEYDLALLRFYEPVQFQPNILPVCVPQNDENFVGRTAYVTGWGRLYEDGPLPSILQEVSVPVINNTVCESMYRSAGYIEHIPNIFICAGWRRGGFDSCEGDSGGPMVIQRPDKRFLLAGVISWGIGCAEPNQPGVYTRISEFRDWINQILQF